MLGAEGVGMGDAAIQIAPQRFDAHVHAGAFEAGCLEGSGGTICIEITETGRLHSGVADFGDLGHCSGEVGFGVVANRPELEGNRGVGHSGGLVIG